MERHWERALGTVLDFVTEYVEEPKIKMSIIKFNCSIESLLNKEEIAAKLNRIDKKLSYATLLGDISTFDISFSGNEFSLKQKPFYEDFKQRRALINEVHGKIYQFVDKSKIVLRFNYSNMALIIYLGTLYLSIFGDFSFLIRILFPIAMIIPYAFAFFTYKNFFSKLFRKNNLVYKENKIKKGSILKKFNTILMIVFGIALIIFGPQLQIG